MKSEDREFKGIIFFGLMLTADGPKVLEYNARFGDPETQVVLPRMKNDIVDVFEACIDGTLDQIDLQFEDNAAVCVVLASAGYPEHYEKGKKITGLENFKDKDGYYVFHAGSKFDAEGCILCDPLIRGETDSWGALLSLFFRSLFLGFLFHLSFHKFYFQVGFFFLLLNLTYG